MNMDDIIATVDDFDGVLGLRPGPGDGSPEISWGDTFFYYSPDGTVPAGQPFATIVTKNYPGDEASGLDAVGAFRVNIDAGKDEFVRFVGRSPREAAADPDPNPAGRDTVLAHPVYGSAGWLAVVNPGPRTAAVTHELLLTAYRRARARTERRS